MAGRSVPPCPRQRLGSAERSDRQPEPLPVPDQAGPRRKPRGCVIQTRSSPPRAGQRPGHAAETDDKRRCAMTMANGERTYQFKALTDLWTGSVTLEEKNG